MSRRTAIAPEFVDLIPDRLEDGVLYISIGYGTAAHACCCGCGREVTTPLTRADWRLIFDGESVSLQPSIGNWSFPCQSHYFVTMNRIRWVEAWSPEQIAEGRRLDGQRKVDLQSDSRSEGRPGKPTTLWRRISSVLRRRSA
jgi:hypothetical protein